ncbi:MAG: hypothetical protein ABII13_05680, partial [Patescibacteria group bacterium]
PERWSYERLMQKKSEMESEGLGHSKFHQEYLNDPVSDERRAFPCEWLEEEFADEDLKFRTLNRYICIDTAQSKSRGSDYTGVAIVDWDSENNWFVQYAKRYTINAAELVDLIFDLWQTWHPLKIGVEKLAFYDQVEPFLKIRREQLGIYPLVVELEHHGQRKEDRIRGALQGRFESHKILFKKDANDDTKILKSELYDFPMGKNDDLCESLSYVVQLGNRPFSKRKDQMGSVERELLEYRKKQKGGIIDRL